MLPDYFAILQVTPQATQADIKVAYRTLAKKYHPDVAGNGVQEQMHFANIKIAYETLTQPSLRYEYLEKRWLYKSEGKQLDATELVTSNSLVKTFIALEKELYYTAIGMNQDEYVAIKLNNLLSPTNCTIINSDSNAENTTIISTYILKLIPHLPVHYFPILQQKISGLKFVENKIKQQFDIAITKKIRDQKLEKSKWLIVIMLVSFLLAIIWLIGKK